MRSFALGAVLATAISCGGAGARLEPSARRSPPLSAAAYAHYLRGRLLAFEGDNVRAAEELRMAAAAAPMEPQIQVALAGALYAAGHRHQARRVMETAQGRFPESSEVWRESGRIYRGVGRPADSARAYRRAIALAPDAEACYLGLAAAYRALGRPEKVEETYRDLVRRRPQSVAGHYRLGHHLASGETRAAEEHLRQALELDPDHHAARVELARLLRSTRRPREAVRILREAFDRSSDVEVGARLFQQQLELGDRAGAAALVHELDRDDLDVDVRIAFGYMYLQIGEPAAAHRLAARLARRNAQNDLVRLLEARALAALGRRADAARILLAVTPDHPVGRECRALAAELLARTGKDVDALAAVDEALVASPRDGQLLAAKGLVFELAGRLAEARATFTASLSAAPNDVQLLYAFAAFEDRQGRSSQAIDLANRIIAIAPDHVAALNFVGYTLVERSGDLARAEQILIRALRLAPADAYVIDSVGWLRLRQGRTSAARALLERAARLAPSEPEILWHLAELYLSRKEATRALGIYQRALTLRPDGDLLRRIEGRIQALRPRTDARVAPAPPSDGGRLGGP